MPTYTIEKNLLILKPKRSNYFVLGVLIIRCFLCLALPITVFVLTIMDGDNPHFGGIILLGIMGLISFYLPDKGRDSSLRSMTFFLGKLYQ